MQSQSIFDNSTSKLSVFEFEIVSGTEPSELDFEFDDIVVNSKVYRRELRKAKDVIQRSVSKETLDEDSDLDTIKLRGNDFVSSKMLQRIVDSPPTHNVKTLHFESVDSLFKSRKLLDGIEEKVWEYQNESPSADHLSSVQMCHICDKTPEEHHSLVDQQPYYLHEGRRYCHLHFCKYHTSSCRACEFPIITPPHDPMHNQANNAFHPACYGIVNNWGLYVPVSIEGRKYIDSLNSGSIGDLIDVGIQRQHDVYVQRIHQAGINFLSVFNNSLRQGLRYRYRPICQDPKEAFRSWKTMLELVLCLFSSSESVTTPGKLRQSYHTKEALH